MRSIRSVWGIALRNLEKWFLNPRVIAIAVFYFATMFIDTRAVVRFSEHVEIRVTPWLFSHMIGGWYFHVTLMLCAIFLFADAPFLDESAPYVIVRSGRRAWVTGQVVYVLLASMVFVVFCYLSSVLPLLGHLKWDTGWGKVIGTLAQTEAAELYDLKFIFSTRILHMYQPIPATLYSMLLTWLICSIVGLLMFVLNLYTARSIGTILCCVITVFDYYIYNFLSGAARRYSPITLSTLSNIDGDYITLGYAFSVLSAILVALMILSVAFIRKKDLSAVHEI